MTETIYRETLDEQQRLSVPFDVYGIQFLRVESAIFDFASQLSDDYRGGLWNLHSVSNGAFYASPAEHRRFTVRSPNGYEGEMSADAFGLICVLFATSHLSFGGPETLVRACVDQHYLLRDWMLQHDEARAILAAID